MANNSLVLILFGILFIVAGVVLFPTLQGLGATTQSGAFSAFLAAALPTILGIVLIIAGLTGRAQHVDA